jgi:hypothetical protein
VACHRCGRQAALPLGRSDPHRRTKEIWGLTALHIITKDIPNWFWTTFEHIDNKARPPIWLLPSVDRLACPAPPHDCEAVPSGIGLEGTKWANYRLRGTQVDFIDTLGTHTLLANSRLEAIQRRSSCITCHALSARDGLGNTPRFDFLTGPPTADMFSTVAQSPQPLMQLDFVISLTRAARKQP